MNASFNNRYWVSFYIAVCFLIIVVARLFVAAPAGSDSPGEGQAAGQEVGKIAVAEPVPAEPTELRLLFFGDIMLDRHVKELIDANGGVPYLFEKWQLPEEWQDTDVMMANMEGAVTTGGEHYPPQTGIDFAFDPADVAAFKEYGFTAFTLANNHMSDQGQAGFTETQGYMEELGYVYTGCPDRQVDDCSVATTTVQGVTIGLAGYSMVYGLLDETAMAEQVRALASTTDFVIANVHWGVEYVHTHNGVQERVAHALVDAGADLVIGHHPHVVQDTEVYDGVPIFYSLGNLIFDQYFSKETQEGVGVGVVVDRDRVTGSAAIERIEMLPYRSVRSQVELMEGERKREWLEWFEGLTQINTD